MSLKFTSRYRVVHYDERFQSSHHRVVFTVTTQVVGPGLIFLLVDEKLGIQLVNTFGTM